MLEAGETPALCRNGKSFSGKSDTADKVSRARVKSRFIVFKALALEQRVFLCPWPRQPK